MENIETSMNPNEREEWPEELAEGLRALQIKEAVRKAAAQRVQQQKNGGKPSWFWMLGIAAAILLIVYLAQPTEQEIVVIPSQEDVISPPTPPVAPMLPAEDEQELPDEPTAVLDDESEPVAMNHTMSNSVLGKPMHGMPRGQIRSRAGNDESEREVLQAKYDQIWFTQYPLLNLPLTHTRYREVDSLLKHTRYALAYAKLNSLERRIGSNDTLLYLRGYSLLEKGEGQEAYRTFENIVDIPPQWEAQIQWYKGLALLISEDKPVLNDIIKQIASQPNHLYYQQALKVVATLEK
ncbi:MAG: hypothetical protein R2795_23310 [Saprospiraceae bacterium]